jgi:tetratricopeptide (TPR) repeat protein
MPGGLLGQLGQLFHRTAPQPPAPPAQPSPVPAFNDPVVAALNQQLARAQPQPVPTEDAQLQQEQHAAWARNDFERCIVIFSRLHELHPDDPTWPDKLKVSYFNRGKQYETAGDVARATQCYYAALALDADFPEAKQAAEQLLAQQGAARGA